MKEVNTEDLKSSAERLSSSSLEPSTKEEWRLVEKHGGIFEVSSHGNMRRKGSEKILKQAIGKNGYRLIASYIGGRKGTAVCFRVHCEIARAFIPNPHNKPFVNHKDGCKTNNSLDNLEWCTAAENTRHAHLTGLIKVPRGDANKNTRISDKQVIEIKELSLSSGRSLRSLCREHKISHSTVIYRYNRLKGINNE